MLIDGHLDLAYNVTKGRDLTLTLDALRPHERREREEAMVTLPELGRAGVDIVFATIFVMPRAAASDPGAQATYRTPEEARSLALDQLGIYQAWEGEGRIHLIRDRSDLGAYPRSPGDPLGVVLLMEGADPIRDASDVAWWFGQGVRIIGPAWKQTRYAGGTGAPGPLTPAGVELLHAMRELGLILDVSHLAEEAFWQALDLDPASVIASHSNCRALVDSDRHLSDAMIESIGTHDGVVGLVLANKFLRDGVERDDPTVGVADVARHATRVADLIGWDRVALGTDFDGGFGRQETPKEIDRGSDLGAAASHMPRAATPGVLGGNWGSFLKRSLPP